MKLAAKILLSFIFFFSISTVVTAQQKRALYNAVVFGKNKEKAFGKITAINDTAIILMNKRDLVQSVRYENIDRIKVYKYHRDIGYSVITGALALGSIVAAQSIDDAGAAVAVGIGGTIGVVGLSMLLHNVIHGTEAKMKAKDEAINYKTVSAKLNKYVAGQY